MLVRELEHKEQAMHADNREKRLPGESETRRELLSLSSLPLWLLDVLHKPRSSKQSDQLVAVLPGG